MTAFLKTEVTPSNTLERPLPARPEVFSQVFKCSGNLQDLEPAQTKCKENARDGAGNIFKFFKWFEYTAWIKKKKWGWEEIQTLNGVTLLTNCFFVHHLTWPSWQLGMVRWVPVLQGGGNGDWEFGWGAQSPTAEGAVKAQPRVLPSSSCWFTTGDNFLAKTRNVPLRNTWMMGLKCRQSFMFSWASSNTCGMFLIFPQKWL